MVYVFASQGRHSRWPLKIATQGGHGMLKRPLDIQFSALYVKTVTSYQKIPGIP